ncbi:MAG: DUF1294 domain-containing protein [Clostridia bacterium]|nr:DUF1294 domain-containing protein [Clostridia bacterium]
MIYFQIYLCAINIIAIIVCTADKIKAQLNKWRISEKTLLAISVIGGALGMYITMLIIRHKTKHKTFMIGLPFLILVHVVAILLYLQRNA